MPRFVWRRAVTALIAPLLATPVVVAATSRSAPPAPPRAVAVAADVPTTSAEHPYSMPVWLPVRDETYLDCVLTNPGCGDTHRHWTMDMVLETLKGSRPSDPGVYAMGAGIMHVQVAKGRACRDGATADFGTTVWIDHGGGVVSRYGHLDRILYADGTRLAAGQRFAVMGTTGKGGNCSVPYVDFQIRRHGVSGPTQRFDTLAVCASASTTATWPTDLDATKHIRPAPQFPERVRRTNASFNDIPQRTVDFPATSGDCIPTSVPATPNAPSTVALTPSGRGRLTVSWTKPASTPRVSSVQVQLSEYHPSTRTWDYAQNEEYRSVAPTTNRYAFTGLVSGHKYRATVVYRNSEGFGRSVRTGAVTSVAPPATPTARRAFVTRTKKAASLHFAWTRPKENGLRISGFHVQVRRITHGHAGPWVTIRLPRSQVSYYRPHCRRHVSYQMRVRAAYPGGVTGFLTRTLQT